MSQRRVETDLREFLRTRRARITPQQAGLPAFTGVRRVPGLRREEVAQLAGVSVDYYVRLERGRNTAVSASVLDAVARALQLDEVERLHLYALAKPIGRRSQPLSARHARQGLLRTLENIADVPALLLGHRLDVLAMNRLAQAFYLDFHTLPATQQNMARYMFLNDAARDLYVEWPETARENVGMLRLYAGRHPNDPLLRRLIQDLSAADADFRRWWTEHDVFLPRYGIKRYHHPVVGDLVLGYEAFTPAGDTDQTLGIHTVEPGSPSEKALRALANWTTAAAHLQARQPAERKD